MEKSRRSYLILKSPHYMKVILLLSIPIILNGFLKSFTEIIDIYFLSHLDINQSEIDNIISVITSTTPLFSLFFTFEVVLTIVGTILISQVVENEYKVNNINNILIKVSLIVGIFLNVLLFFGAPFFSKKIFPCDSLNFNYACIYLKIRSFELVPAFLMASFISSRHAFGDTLTPLFLKLLSFIINLLLISFFIKRYLIKGFAIVKLITTIISTFLIIKYIIKYAKVSKINKEEIKFFLKKLYPVLLSNILINIGFLVINIIIRSYNFEIASSVLITTRINNSLILIINGLCSCLIPLIGQNISHNELFRVKKFIINVVKMIIVLSFCDIIFLLPFREDLVNILVKNENLNKYCTKYMVYVLLSIPLTSLFEIFISIFHGYSYTKTSMFVSICRLWGFRIPLMIYFLKVNKLNVDIIGWIMIFSNLFSVLICVVIYLKLNKERNKEYGRNYQKIS